MTNLESIRQGKHKAFNDLLKNIGNEEIANMISENSCEVCICKNYCDEKYDFENMTCQQTIKKWLSEEVEE